MYTSVEFIKRTLSNNTVEINRAKSMLKNAEDAINKLQENLLAQFTAFVCKNRSLYDADFVELLEEGVEIHSIEVQNPKRAVKIKVESKIHGIHYVMVPFLFITAPEDYKISRQLQNEFDKGATQKTVEKHFDSEISKLLAEVEMLKKRKSVIKSQIGKLWE